MSILLAGNKIGVIPMKTEGKIIKALEYCSTNNFCSDECPYYGISCDCNCKTTTMKDALHLLKKQQAEIERLKCEMGKLLPKDCSYAVQMEVSNNLETKIRAEAVKEFVERLKEMKYESIEWSHGKHPYVVEESDIDNLVAEMVGEK